MFSLNIEIIKYKLRYHLGMKDWWKRKEAEAKVKKEEFVPEDKIKQEGFILQAEGNNIARQASII